MRRFVVDINGTGDFVNVQEALNSVVAGEDTIIFIKSGKYKEKLIVDKPFIRFEGEDCENTVITFDDGAFMNDDTGKPMGTFKTASVHITRNGEGFSAKNITFENSAGMGDVVGQAVAVYVDCDKAVFKNCKFLARQDTLLTAPMHEDIVKEPDIFNRQYFEDCYIEGDVDFIFGGAVAVFKNCEIFSLDKNKEINGYVTAACTSEKLDFGYVFFNCRLTGNARKGSVYLGRPWREYARTVFIDCFLGSHINKEGFCKWKNFEERSETCYYAQYNSSGEEYDEKSIADWTHILSEQEVAEYTIENIFKGWIPNI